MRTLQQSEIENVYGGRAKAGKVYSLRDIWNNMCSAAAFGAATGYYCSKWKGAAIGVATAVPARLAWDLGWNTGQAIRFIFCI